METKRIPVNEPPKPQTDDNKHGPDYDNTTSGWVAGDKPATDKPGFDTGVHGGKGPTRSGPPNAEKWGRAEAQKRYGRK